jgi:type VII secretion protein EccB
MGPQSTRLHVSGYRFLMRRTEHALVRADVRMIDDPLRAQSISLLVGCVLAVAVLAGCGVLAVLRPHGEPGDASIVRERDSGALYVRIGDTWHPVPNLASARLIVGSAAEPKTVAAGALGGVGRGPMAGIPGAPSVIGVPLDAAGVGWTVCDTAASTTVLVGGPTGTELGAHAGLLVAARSEGPAATYLLHDGRRAAVDLRDTAVVRALRLDGVTPRPVSRVLLDSIPESPPITAPRIPHAGRPGALAGYPVGTVVSLSRAGGDELYVVLADGVQRIGEVAADLIRFTATQPHTDVPAVTADALAATGIIADAIPTAGLPDRLTMRAPEVACARWSAGGSGAAVVLVDGRETIASAETVELAQADGAGPNVDAVRIPAGRSAYVRPVGVTGAGGSAESRLLLTDSGVVFGVPDDDTARTLGVTAGPAPAPWPVLARLPRGPELSRDRASAIRDAAPAG